MNDNNPIKYSDLVQPDGAVTDLIGQLTDLGAAYGKTLTLIKKEAIQVRASLEQVSGATEEGQKVIRETAVATEMLAKKNKEVTVATKEQLVELERAKLKKAELIRIAKAEAKIAESMADSFDALSAQYTKNTLDLNKLSTAMRQGTVEGRELEAETKALFERMKQLKSAGGGDQLNVGNYPQLTLETEKLSEAIKNAIGLNTEFGQSLKKLADNSGSSKQFFGGIGASVRAFGTTLLGLLANPAFAVIAGIASVGAAFKFWFDYNKGLQEATKLTQQFTGLSGSDLRNFRGEVQAVSDTFGQDYKAVLEASNSVAKQFGISQAQALTVVKDGFLAGANANAEYLQTLKEYPTFFAQAGLSAEQFVAITSQTATAGIFSDKGVDAIKEADIRIRELTPATEKAIQSIGLSSEAIQKGLRDGSLTTFQVIQQVSAKLNELPANSAAVGTAVADIFGGAGEDAGLQYLKTLSNIELNLDTVKGKSGELGRIQEEQLNAQIELSNTIAAIFDFTGGTFESMTANLKLFVTNGLLSVIRYVVDLSNYFIELHNNSLLLKGAIQAIVLAWKNNFTVVKALFTFAINSVQILGQALKGAFTLNWDDVKGAWAAWGENLRNFSSNVVDGVTDNFREGYDNMAKKVKPIVLVTKMRTETEGKNTTGGTTSTGTEGKNTTGGNTSTGKVSKSKTNKTDKEDLDKIFKTNLDLRRKREDEENRLIKDEDQKRKNETNLQYERQIEDLRRQLEKEKGLTVEGKQSIAATIVALEQQQTEALAKIEAERVIKILEIQERGIQLQLDSVKKGTEEEQNLKLQLIEAQRQTALAQNALLPENERQSADGINSKFAAQTAQTVDTYMQSQLEIFATQQKFSQSEFDLLKSTEKEKTRFRLEAEKARLQKVLELNAKANEKLSDNEVKTIQNNIEKVDQEIERNDRPGDVYELFGLNVSDEGKQVISDATGFAIDQVKQLAASRLAAADAAVQQTGTEVEAARDRLNTEIAARNAGFANNAVTAQKELDLAKKNQDKALKEREKAVKQQQALDTITQGSSLVTAAAKIWSTLGSIPLLAVGAIALMFGSFVAAKVKANQLAKQKFRDGGTEYLSGGSHQSGNDIDLGTRPDGTERRAEGGEMFAVFSKNATRRHRRLIPDVVKTINQGTFVRKYMGAFAHSDTPTIVQGPSADMRETNLHLREIRKQGERKYEYLKDGTKIETYKNLKKVSRAN